MSGPARPSLAFDLMVAGQRLFHEETLNSSMPEKWDSMRVLLQMFGPPSWKDDRHVTNSILAAHGVEPGEDDVGAFRRIFGIPGESGVRQGNARRVGAGAYAAANPSRPKGIAPKVPSGPKVGQVFQKSAFSLF